MPVSKLSFTRGGSHLETDHRVLKLRSPTLYDPLSQSDSSRSNSSSPLYVNRHWVTYGGESILWLPPDYRASCAAVRHNIVAIGHESGRFTLLSSTRVLSLKSNLIKIEHRCMKRRFNEKLLPRNGLNCQRNSALPASFGLEEVTVNETQFRFQSRYVPFGKVLTFCHRPKW